MILVRDMTGLRKGDQWQVSDKGRILYVASFKKVLTYCTHNLGISIRDFEKAVPAIVDQGHNTLEFDDSRRLLATYKE